MIIPHSLIYSSSFLSITHEKGFVFDVKVELTDDQFVKGFSKSNFQTHFLDPKKIF